MERHTTTWKGRLVMQTPEAIAKLLGALTLGEAIGGRRIVEVTQTTMVLVGEDGSAERLSSRWRQVAMYEGTGDDADYFGRVLQNYRDGNQAPLAERERVESSTVHFSNHDVLLAVRGSVVVIDEMVAVLGRDQTVLAMMDCYSSLKIEERISWAGLFAAAIQRANDASGRVSPGDSGFEGIEAGDFSRAAGAAVRQCLEEAMGKPDDDKSAEVAEMEGDSAPDTISFWGEGDFR